MSEYLSRPVFPLPINWSETPKEEFSYELNEVLLGYASPRVTPVQAQTIRGWEFQVLLENEQAIVDFEAFTAARRGRLNGFWLPSPTDAFEIASAPDGTEVRIKDQGLRRWWEDDAAVHLVFSKPGEAAQHAKISAVDDSGDGYERVILEDGVEIDATWDANRLLYVRMASDAEEATHLADNVQRRTIRVVELPGEYEAAETGQRPVYLYRFFYEPNEGIQWRFTGLNQNISSGGNTWLSFPMEHRDHVQSVETDQDRFTIESVAEAGNPLAQFVPFRLSKQLQVQVMETTFSDPDEVKVIFQGYCVEAKLKGRVVSTQCQSFLDVLGRSFPAFNIQPRCNYFLFAPPCGLSKAAWKIEGHLRAMGGRLVIFDATAWPDDLSLLPVDFYAFGAIETGSLAAGTWEARTIRASGARIKDAIRLEMSAPFAMAVTGQIAAIYPGCDGSAITCRAKFNNFRRWGGHVIAPQNLSVRAMESESPSGNKK